MNFACWDCGDTFKAKAEMYAHCICHRHQRAWYCTYCDKPKAFMTSMARASHDLSKHPNIKAAGAKATGRFSCSHCELKYDDQDKLDRHMSSLHQLRCQLGCSRSFKTSDALKAHCDAMHKHNCQDCKDSFWTEALLAAHALERHTQKCSPCKKVFKTRDALNLHTLDPSAHPFQCQKCRSGFVFEATLEEHIDGNHSWSCSVCQEMCEGPKHRKMHEDLEHKKISCPECEACHTSYRDVYGEPFKRLVTKELGWGMSVEYSYFQSITCQPVYQNLSFEELRLENYARGLKYKSHQPAASVQLGHQIRCPKCPKSFKMIEELFEHAFSHGPSSVPKLFKSPTAVFNPFSKLALSHPQVPQIFKSPGAAPKPTSSEHAFTCEACPGTFFISAAIRDSHLATCKILTSRSDASDASQSPLAQSLPFHPFHGNPTSTVEKHVPPPRYSQPLIQFDEGLPEDRMQAVHDLAKKILAEAEARAIPSFRCKICDAPPFELQEELDIHMKYTFNHKPPQLACLECDVTFASQVALLAHLESKTHRSQWVLTVAFADKDKA